MLNIKQTSTLIFISVLVVSCASNIKSTSSTLSPSTSSAQAAVVGSQQSPGLTTKDNPYFDNESTSILMIAEDRRTQTLISAATTHEIRKCMQALGFTYPKPIMPSKKARPVSFDDVIGVTSFDRASEYGYGLPPESDDDDAVEQITPEQQTDAFVRALQGNEAPKKRDTKNPETGVKMGEAIHYGGCIGKAIDIVYGGIDRQDEYMAIDIMLQREGNETLTLAKQSQKFLETVKTWSSCMATAGYSFSSPDDLSEKQWPEPRPSQVELETAKTDVRCKESTGMIAVFREEVRREAAEREKKYVGLLEKWDTLTKAFVKRAEDVLKK
jgi:hypothetical protein